jgi:hypothetical protein
MFGNCRLEPLGAAAAHLYFEAFGYLVAKLKGESIPVHLFVVGDAGILLWDIAS